MNIHRVRLRSAADLAATIVWTGPAIPVLGASQCGIWVTGATSAPGAFSWEVSHDGVAWVTGAPPLLCLASGDAIAGQALTTARLSVLSPNFAGGVVDGIPWRFARPKITGHASTIVTALQVECFTISDFDNPGDIANLYALLTTGGSGL